MKIVASPVSSTAITSDLSGTSVLYESTRKMIVQR